MKKYNTPPNNAVLNSIYELASIPLKPAVLKGNLKIEAMKIIDKKLNKLKNTVIIPLQITLLNKLTSSLRYNRVTIL